MKKLLSVLFAVLFVSVTGLANAHQATYDPQTSNADGTYITVPVYNNSGSALDAGDVVVWDVDASTGDNDAYVTTTTTANTGLVAGVVWPSAIAASSSGSIAIWGIVQCDISTATSVAEASEICTSTVAGGGGNCGTAGVNSYAVSNVAGAAGSQISCTLSGF